jgi:poly-gamma-glutamate synthesis protein (capsule biosynthesis protein)
MRKETALIFTGDIGFDKYMDRKWDDEALLAPEVLEYLHSADHLIINVEGPLSEQKKAVAPNGIAALTHSMNPAAAGFFDRIGADIWNICNNHICDAGPEGIADTLREAEKRGVLTLGAGRNLAEASAPVVIDEAGGIGLIGVGYQRACRKASEDTAGCFSWSDMDLIRQQILKIRESCRYCIVVAHGGEEFTALPSPYTRQRYLDYLEMGADIVVSHHPHVPMNYETVGEKVIFYSLGNFVFDTDYQRSQYHTEDGLFVKLLFSEEGFRFAPFPIRIDRATEQIVKGELPLIFRDVNASEYEKLAPLAAKMFLENTKRQLRYLRPAEFEHATEEDFYRNFYEPLRSGRVPGECLDFQILYPLAQKESEGAWKESTLEDVKRYILEQIPEPV